MKPNTDPTFNATPSNGVGMLFAATVIGLTVLALTLFA